MSVAGFDRNLSTLTAATVAGLQNVLPTREEWDALGEALEDAKEWRDEAVDKITALRSVGAAVRCCWLI
jgi:formylglycine-generating enzyme required for sulfatase activity